MEICFLLLAEFIKDERMYVLKKGRIDLVCHDLLSQIQLLSGIVDEDSTINSKSRHSASLTQNFPFTGEHMPPCVKASPNIQAISPGLELLTSVLIDALDKLSHAQVSSLKNVITRIVTSFQMFFVRWTVGMGIEPQLNHLASLVGLPKIISEKENCLDYTLLVRPQKVTETLTMESFDHAEDFFFRSVHLGTDCWAFIVSYQLKNALDLAEACQWDRAAALIQQVSLIFNYLGDHVMMLTAMVLRDYLELKVEIEGTSGEGSQFVKSFKSLVVALLQPLARLLVDQRDDSQEDCVDTESNTLRQALVLLYSTPEACPSLYAYAKALETIESSLLGGFYYKHFMLATNVIGSTSKGTMNKSVQALRSTYESACFPILDKVRCELGEVFNDRYKHRKGRIMQNIAKKRSTSGHTHELSPHDSTNASSRNLSECQSPASSQESSSPTLHESLAPLLTGVDLDTLAEKLRKVEQGLLRLPQSRTISSQKKILKPSDEDTTLTLDRHKEAEQEYMRRQLFSTQLVPKELKLAHADTMAGQCSLSFHSHAFGCIPPMALVEANRSIYGMYAGLGNASWDKIFGEEMPHARGHIRRLVGLAPDGSETIEFAHNSHELVTRIMSTVLGRFAQCEASKPSSSLGSKLPSVATSSLSPLPFRVLTTDTEFYSLTRQLNRMMSTDSRFIQVEVVDVVPCDTFERRFCERLEQSVAGFDFIYVSHITYTQLTVFREISSFVANVEQSILLHKEKMNPSRENNSNGRSYSEHSHEYQYMILIDAYHSFAALPTDITGIGAIYLAGTLKHAGSGANLAFAVIPPHLANISPFATGWLADQSVLGPDSGGIQMRSSVGYTDGFRLMGSTPAFGYPLVCFNRVMDQHQRHGISVHFTHRHVLSLQRQFINGLRTFHSVENKDSGHKLSRFMTLKRLRKSAIASNDEAYNSHTLVFEQDTASDAQECINALRMHGIGIDNRKNFVRVGFGLNHSKEDVDRLLGCLKCL